MADEDDTLRASLEEAISSTDADLTEPKSEVIPDTPHPDAPPAVKEPPVETPVEPVSASKDKDKPDIKEEDKTAPAAPEEPPATATAKAPGAPESWNPGLREKWSEIPADVQAQISKREAEITSAFQATSHARQTAENFHQVVAPYQALMAAEGIQDPLVAVQNMMQTVATLSMGNGEQKAQRMAALIKQYGIDINTLDAALVGENVSSETSQMETLIDQRMAPVNELLQRFDTAQQGQAARRNSGVVADIDTFSGTAEFLSDVRMDMANIFDAASAGGREMDLQRAYDIACQMNPDIKAVIDQRAEAARIVSGNDGIKRKRVAASSISGAPGGGEAAARPTDGSVRADLEAAMESLQTG